MEAGTSAPQTILRSYEDYGETYGAAGKKGGGSKSTRSQGDRRGDSKPGSAPQSAPRSPAITPRQPSSNGQRQSTASMASPIGEPPNADNSTGPENAQFVAPTFPHPAPLTSTSSHNQWAIMLEQACQSLEAVLGPYLQAVLCECITMNLIPAADKAAAGGAPSKPPRTATQEAGSSSDGVAGTSGDEAELAGPLPSPPYSAAACVELLLRHEWVLANKFPLTIRKRLEAASTAFKQLSQQPDKLTSSEVLAAEQAMRSIVQDCLKAMSLPSLLGAGSRQFMAFAKQARPEFESQALYLETLAADCQESVEELEAQRAMLQLQTKVAAA